MPDGGSEEKTLIIQQYLKSYRRNRIDILEFLAVEVYDLDKISIIHQEIQRGKPSFPKALINLILEDIPKVGSNYLSLVPKEYIRSGVDLAQMMDIRAVEAGMFSRGFAIRMGLNRYTQTLEKVASVSSGLLMDEEGIAEMTVNRYQLCQDWLKSCRSEAVEVFQEEGLEKGTILAWFESCVTSGKSLATVFWQSSLNPNYAVSMMKILRGNILERRVPHQEDSILAMPFNSHSSQDLVDSLIDL